MREAQSGRTEAPMHIISAVKQSMMYASMHDALTELEKRKSDT
jgi:hypothetical protein